MERLGFIVLEGALLVLSFYLLVAVVVSLAKRFRTHTLWNHIYRSVLLLLLCTKITVLIVSLFRNFRGKASRGDVSHKRIRAFLDGCFLFFVLVGVSAIALNLVSMLLPQLAKQCVTTGMSFQILHAVGLTALYVFLWTRQRVLCAEPALQQLVTPCLVRFSWVVFGAIVFAAAAGIPALAVTINDTTYITNNQTGNCFHVKTRNSNTMTVYCGYVVIILTQGSLLFLFVEIMNRHMNQLSKLNSQGRQLISCERIHTLVRNCCLAAGVTMIADIAIIALDAAGGRKILSQKELFALWDLNYAISMTCTLFCFGNWFEMIWPWRCEANHKTPKKAPQLEISSC